MIPPDRPDVTDGDGDPVKPSFRPDVQGLRAVAVGLVVLFHTGVGFPGGFLGVDVFFVISGFVIGRLLLSEHERTGRIALGAFYARRVRRLFPALAAMLVVVGIASLFLLSPLGPLRETVAGIGIGAALYVANFAVLAFQKNGYFDLGADTNPLLHTWTLGVEEQFYLFLPVLLIVVAWAVRRRPGTFRRRLTVTLLAFTALSFLGGALFAGAFGHHDGLWATRGRFAFYSSLTRAWEFLVGVLVALAEPLGRLLSRRLAAFVATGGLAAIVCAGLTQSATTATPGPATLVPVVGTAMVILAAAPAGGWVHAVLASRPAVWTGDRSYGWYLWHWPVIVFVGASYPTAPPWVLLLAALGALVPTVVSYRWLEQPVRRNPGWIGGRRAVGLALGCSALGVVAFVGLANVPDVSTPGTRAVEDSLAPRGPAPTGCFGYAYEDDPRRAQACTWAVEQTEGWVVLVGDSSAGSLAPALAEQANQAGYSMNLLSRPGCPFADVVRVYADPPIEAACRQFVSDAMDAITATRPALVVIASRQDAYVHLDEFTLADPLTGAQSDDETIKATLFQAGLTRTMEDLADLGVPGVVVATIPQLAPFNIETCPAWRLWARPAGCGRTLDRVTVQADRDAGLAATEAAVGAVPDMHLVDFIDELCSPEECSTRRGEDWMYRNSSHLSPLGVASLGPTIGEQVMPHARGWASSPPQASPGRDDSSD